MIIRVLKSEESKKLEDFLVSVYAEDERLLAKESIACMFSADYRKAVFIVAVDGDEIIGAAAYSEEIFTVNVWGISWVSVAPKKRNQGLGEGLIRECLNKISENSQGDGLSVILLTYPDKTGLYEKVGFEVMGRDCDGGSFMVKNIKKT